MAKSKSEKYWFWNNFPRQRSAFYCKHGDNSQIYGEKKSVSKRNDSSQKAPDVMMHRKGTLQMKEPWPNIFPVILKLRQAITMGRFQRCFLVRVK